jgi:hypothetical protein
MDDREQIKQHAVALAEVSGHKHVTAHWQDERTLVVTSVAPNCVCSFTIGTPQTIEWSELHDPDCWMPVKIR